MSMLEKRNNVPVISHHVMAEQGDIKHRSVRLLIDKHIEDLEEFGRVSFEMTTVKNSVGAVNEEKTYYLNEPQATLLMTYLQNTTPVRAFKKELVKAFYQLRYQNKLPQNINLTDPELINRIAHMKTEQLKGDIQVLISKLTVANNELHHWEGIQQTKQMPSMMADKLVFLGQVEDLLRNESLPQTHILEKLGFNQGDMRRAWLKENIGIRWNQEERGGHQLYSIIPVQIEA